MWSGIRRRDLSCQGAKIVRSNSGILGRGRVYPHCAFERRFVSLSPSDMTTSQFQASAQEHDSSHRLVAQWQFGGQRLARPDSSRVRHSCDEGIPRSQRPQKRGLLHRMASRAPHPRLWGLRGIHPPLGPVVVGRVFRLPPSRTGCSA